MPDLPQYNDRDVELHPTEAGEEAHVQAGRRIGAFYDQAGHDIGQNIERTGTDFQTHLTMSQMSQHDVAMAQGVNALDEQWNTIASDPNSVGDPTVRQKFMTEKVQPFITQMQSGFSTKEGVLFVALQAYSMIAHFNEKTIADMSSMAGIAAKRDAQVSSLYGQHTAYGDSSTVDLVNGQMDEATEAKIKTLGLTGPQAETLRAWTAGEKGKVLVKGYEGDADRAMADPDPTSAAAKFDALRARLANDTRFGLYGEGGSDESNDATHTVSAYIDHAVEVQARVGKAAAETAKAAAVAAGSSDYTTLALQAGEFRRNGTGPTPEFVQGVEAYARKYGTIPELASHVETLLQQANDGQKEVIDHTMQRTDPRVTTDLYARGNLAPGTPGRTTQNDWDYHYNVAKDISKADYEQGVASLDRRARDPEFEAGEKQLDAWIATTLKPKFGFKPSQTLDTDGDPSQVNINGSGVPTNAYIVYADAVRYAHEVYMSNINSGMSASQAFDRMTNEASGHSLTAHMPYWQAALNSGNASVYLGGHPQTEVEGGPPTAPRAKGETQAQYLKRMGL